MLCFGSSEMLWKKMNQGGAAVSSLKSQRKGGLGYRFRALAREELPLNIAVLVASLSGVPWSLREKSKEAHLRGKKGVGVLKRVPTVEDLLDYLLAYRRYKIIKEQIFYYKNI